MELLKKSDLPLDHWYYRTISPVYKKYLVKCWLKIHELPNNKFGWIKNVFWLFKIAKFERVNEEPEIENLKQNCKWDIKNMLCYDKDKVVAWLYVIDYNWNSSAHLVSFLTKEWKKKSNMKFINWLLV